MTQDPDGKNAGVSFNAASFEAGRTEDQFVAYGEISISGHKQYEKDFDMLPHFAKLYELCVIGKARKRVHTFVATDWALRAGAGDGLCNLSNTTINTILLVSHGVKKFPKSVLNHLSVRDHEIVFRLRSLVSNILSGKPFDLTAEKVCEWHKELCAPIDPSSDKGCQEYEAEISSSPGEWRKPLPSERDRLRKNKNDTAKNMKELCLDVMEFCQNKDKHHGKSVNLMAAETYIACMHVAPFDVGNYAIAQLIISYIYCQNGMLPVAVVPESIPLYSRAVKPSPNELQFYLSLLESIFTHLQVETLKVALFQYLAAQRVKDQLKDSIDDVMCGDSGKMRDYIKVIAEQAYKDAHFTCKKFVNACRKDIEDHPSELNVEIVPECVEPTDIGQNSNLLYTNELEKKLEKKLDTKKFHRHFSVRLDYRCASKSHLVTFHLCKFIKKVDSVVEDTCEIAASQKIFVAFVGTAWKDAGENEKRWRERIVAVGDPFEFTTGNEDVKNENALVCQAQLYSAFERWFVGALQLALKTDVPESIRETQRAARTVQKIAGNINPGKGRFGEGLARPCPERFKYNH